MMTPEAKARQRIGPQLEAASWVVQDMKTMNLHAQSGVAIREFPTATGPANYMLFADVKAIEILDPKKEGETHSVVQEHAVEYGTASTKPLRDYQVDAIANLENSLSDNRPRALIQMATGSGKPYTAMIACYRLIKHAGAKRILLLVDRSDLGRQTANEFQQYATPDAGRKFTATSEILSLN